MTEFQFTEDDIRFMRLAIEQAQEARAEGEVPIGAVVVRDGEVIGRGRNAKAIAKTATSHAEIIAIEDASRNTGDWRLDECSLYVTVEPCLMCAGTIIHSRIRNVVFGVPEPKFGGVISLAHTFDIQRLNHRVNYKHGIFEDEIREMLKSFFRELRGKK
ncbi:nucleoside deaminase [Geovibrio thiophilus]|uniref:tRNA-specific adenosine deaminase n=1 Tax=Geovibrio thiophilus TaxID=139438 RepID=A0A3R5YZK2_9BACT|nr:nucleoside deaminase [Geovibrio thiophilus]QAR33364.1 nucleoside deaminase [Geovibrio thiophilus]